MNKLTGACLLLWAKTMFGPVALNKKERALRMFEEACELAQAADIFQDDARTIMERTWSRPKDTVEKEVGGLLVTVLAFCEVHGIDPEEALLKETRRIMSKPNEHWQAKHDAKVEAGTAMGLSGMPIELQRLRCTCARPSRSLYQIECLNCGKDIPAEKALRTTPIDMDEK